MKSPLFPIVHLLVLFAGVATGLLVPVERVLAATANVSVTALLNIPLTVSGTTAIRFGTVNMVSGGDTVTLDESTCNISGAGGTTFLGVHGCGGITLAGMPNTSVNFTDPADITVDFMGGAKHAYIENFVVNGGDTQSLDGSGALTVQIGAQLRYQAGITDGGNINEVAAFTVAYN